MREIKFRAWDKLQNQMRPPFGLFAIPEWTEPIISPHDVVAMQFTGLRDKNGKEIYEGDIVRLKPVQNDNVQIGEVVWSDERHSWGWRVFHHDHAYGLPQEQIEVIGNIYETPELLSTN